MGAIFGLIFHSLGGFASGSFYIPYRKIQVWSWESAWIVGGVFSWILVPFLAAYLTIPDFMSIILQTESDILFWTYAFGVLWGIGGLTFGLAMRYLGMSLGMSIALSLCSIFGALVPQFTVKLQVYQVILYHQLQLAQGVSGCYLVFWYAFWEFTCVEKLE